MCYGAHFQPIRVAIEEKNHTGKRRIERRRAETWDDKERTSSLCVVAVRTTLDSWTTTVCSISMCVTHDGISIWCMCKVVPLLIVLRLFTGSLSAWKWTAMELWPHGGKDLWILPDTQPKGAGFNWISITEEEHKTMNFNGVICLFRRRKTSHFEINCWQSHQKVNYFGWGVKTNRS